MDLFTSITSFLTLVNGFGIVILWIKYIQQVQQSTETIYKIVSEIQKNKEENTMYFDIIKQISGHISIIKIIQQFIHRNQ